MRSHYRRGMFFAVLISAATLLLSTIFAGIAGVTHAIGSAIAATFAAPAVHRLRSSLGFARFAAAIDLDPQHRTVTSASTYRFTASATGFRFGGGGMASTTAFGAGFAAAA